MSEKLFFKWYGDGIPENTCECVLAGGPLHGDVFLLSFEVDLIVARSARYERVSRWDFIYSGQMGRLRMVWEERKLEKYLYGYMWE